MSERKPRRYLVAALYPNWFVYSWRGESERHFRGRLDWSHVSFGEGGGTPDSLAFKCPILSEDEAYKQWPQFKTIYEQENGLAEPLPIIEIEVYCKE